MGEPKEGTFEWYKQSIIEAYGNPRKDGKIRRYENQLAIWAYVLELSEVIGLDDPNIRKFCFRATMNTREITKRCFEATHEDRYEALYLDFLLLEAPYMLDSFCLYIEHQRKPQDRFYEPRRKTLRKVVDKLQMLEDNELDELFVNEPPRIGKLLADSTPVLTTKGWKKHGELKVGDYVFGIDGKPKRVLAVSEKNYADCLLKFSNGEEIKCHENHEWLMIDRGYNKKERIIETKTFFKRRIKYKENGVPTDRNIFFLPKTSPIQGENIKLSVDPYVFGCWIGDGTTRDPVISICNTDNEITEEILKRGYTIRRVVEMQGCNSITFNNLRYDLNAYGLCDYRNTIEKYIPDEYLYSSVEQRLDFLAGLIDTDGWLYKKENRYTYTSTNKKIIESVITLVSSFGWKPCVCFEEPKISSSGIHGRKRVYEVSFLPTFEIPCKVKRKQTTNFRKSKSVALVSAEKVETEQGNCIQVEDGIYLVGKRLIPTHNSQIITMGTAWHCAKNDELSNLYVTYKEGLGGAFLDGVMEIWTDPTYVTSRVFPRLEIARTDAKNHKVDLGRKKKYATLSGKGLESGLNGEYDAYGWLILDDILEGIQDVLNPDILKRKQIVFDNNVMSRRKEQCKIIWNGTIWSLHDIYMNRMNFLQNSPETKNIRWDSLRIPALDPETDESNFDYDYGVGYSTQYYRALRAKFEENDDLAGWMAQYQQEPIERDGQLFNAEHMNFYNGTLPAEEPLKVACACDVALGGTDYLAMPIAYVYEDGSIYIHDVIFDNSEKALTMPRVVDALIRNNVTNAFFEANAGGEGYKDEVNDKLQERGYKINLTSKYAQQMILSTGGHATKSAARKEQRIWDCAEMIRQFYFRDIGYQNNEYRKFMNNVYSFTMTGKNKNDDAPDSLASLALFLRRGSGVRQSTIIKSPI